MATTYSAILVGDHIQWKNDAPPLEVRKNQRLEVLITLSDDSSYDLNAPVDETAVLESRFRQLADQWRHETKYFSSVSKMALHPAYQQIIGLGQLAVPLILSELQQRPDHWLWALHAITGEDPAPPDASFPEAVEAWIEWGRLKGYLS